MAKNDPNVPFDLKDRRSSLRRMFSAAGDAINRVADTVEEDPTYYYPHRIAGRAAAPVTDKFAPVAKQVFKRSVHDEPPGFDRAQALADAEAAGMKDNPLTAAMDQIDKYRSENEPRELTHGLKRVGSFGTDPYSGKPIHSYGAPIYGTINEAGQKVFTNVPTDTAFLRRAGVSQQPTQIGRKEFEAQFVDPDDENAGFEYMRGGTDIPVLSSEQAAQLDTGEASDYADYAREAEIANTFNETREATRAAEEQQRQEGTGMYAPMPTLGLARQVGGVNGGLRPRDLISLRGQDLTQQRALLADRRRQQSIDIQLQQLEQSKGEARTRQFRDLAELARLDPVGFTNQVSATLPKDEKGLEAFANSDVGRLYERALLSAAGAATADADNDVLNSLYLPVNENLLNVFDEDNAAFLEAENLEFGDSEFVASDPDGSGNLDVALNRTGLNPESLQYLRYLSERKRGR